jgi:hypothetical protein
MLAGLVLWAPLVGPANYSDYGGTIGMLSLMLVYMSVTTGHLRSSLGRAVVGGAVTGLVGTLLLLWPLGTSLFPTPPA